MTLPGPSVSSGGALGAREELVPAAEQRALPVGVRRVGALDGDVARGSGGVQHRRPAPGPGARPAGPPAAGRCRAAASIAPCDGRRLRRRPASSSASTRSSSSRPSVNISSTSTPAGILRPASCCQVAIGSRPGLDLEGPGALGVRGHPGVVPVRDVGVLDHPHRRPRGAVRARSARPRRRACRGPRGTPTRGPGTARRPSPWPAARPRSTTGMTSMTGMRPTISPT